MKPKQYTPLALLFVVALALWLFYDIELSYTTISGNTQGTQYNITYEDRDRNLQPKIENLLHKFDLSLSSYIDESIISQVNNNVKGVKLDAYFRTVFNKSEEIYHITDGAFDITVAPFVNAWGFGSGAAITVDSAAIDSIRPFVGMNNISLIGGKLKKSSPNVTIDVNAIAQGYSADVVADFLERKGVKNYLVEIGGEIVAKGINKKGNAWRIGIDKPIDDNFATGEHLQAIIEISSRGLATSGNYRKFYEKDGVKYVHSIDPKTGYPVQSRLLSTTVLAQDGMTADAFATAFMVMGLEKTIMFLSTHKELDAYLVYSDDKGNFKTYMTPGLKDKVVENIE